MVKPNPTKRGKAKTEMAGLKFGAATVIEYAGSDNAHRRAEWFCRCDCGKEFKTLGKNLRDGKVTSCGCGMNRGKKHRTHGSTETAEYGIWCNMKARCTRPSNKAWNDYGGRGIVVCDRWLNSFANFIADMGLRPTPEHSIDRVETNGNYEPGNCRWATLEEQQRNKRSNIILTHNGKSQTLAEWAAEVGMPYSALWERHELRGWSDEKTLTTPIGAIDGRFKKGNRQQSTQKRVYPQ